MLRSLYLCSAITLAPLASFAETVPLSHTGFGQSFDVSQPSIALHGYIQTDGDFNRLGTLRWYAGSRELPVGSNFLKAEGQTLNVAEHQRLFSVMGTSFGGDGRSTFRLPDLRGRAIKGTSDPQKVGTVSGQGPDRRTTLTEANLPGHTHDLNGETSSVTGSGQPFSIEQQNIALRYQTTTIGNFPGNFTPGDTLAGIEMSARSYARPPVGQSDADGRLIDIRDNTALFSLLGANFGGDGRNTFGLPDINGRIVTGEGRGPGLTNRRLGEKSGSETATLTQANLASHDHLLGSDATTRTGGSQSVSLIQPEIALNWIIALEGIYPTGTDVFPVSLGGDPVMAEMSLFGGTFAPRGWAFAHGQFLPIAQYSALFSLLGTEFGGDGRTTFALPDLRGRTVVGTGFAPGGREYRIGQRFGAEQLTLTNRTMPAHNHTIEVPAAVPLPAGMPLLLGALSMLAFGWRKRRTA